MVNFLKTPKPKKIVFRFLKTFGIGSKEKEDFLENLSMMMASEMPIAVTLSSLKEDIVSPKLLSLVKEIESDINNGKHFWQAIEKSYLFSDFAVSLIRIGEESGKLAENLKLVSKQQQKEKIFRQRLHSAMIYPVLVLSLTFVVGTLVTWFILPRLAMVFSDLRLALPLPTRVLIALAHFLVKWGIFAVPGALAFFAIFIYVLFVNKKTKFLGQKFLFSIPGISGLIREVEVSRFGYILGSLLSAGVPVVESVKLLSKASDFHFYKIFYDSLRQNLEDGNSFQKSFNNITNSKKMIPLPVQHMIASAEQSGKLQEIFFSIAQTFEDKSETNTKNLTVIFEPVLLLVVWSGVLVLSLAVILPIYSLIGGLGVSNANSSAPPPTANVKPRLNTVQQKPASLNVKNSSSTEASPKVRGLEIIKSEGRLTILPDFKYVFLRSQPDKSSKVVGRLFANKTYGFSQMSNGWLFIKLSETLEGWVYAENVQIKN